METQNNNKHTRKPSNAAMLSLIMPGLGQVYNGALAHGLLIAFIGALFLPLFGYSIAINNSVMTIEVIAAGIIFYLAVIIDAYWKARRTAPGYQLKEYNRWYVYILLILLNMGGTIPVALTVRAHLIEAFIVPAASCYPTIVPGDRIIANKIVYNKQEPQPGDMIVFINPENRYIKYIKRIIACAGDTIEIRSGEVYVNDIKLERQPIENQYFDNIKIDIEAAPLTGHGFYETNGNHTYKIFLADSPHDMTSQNLAKMTIPANHCFVLGDNRNISHDSRAFGPIPLATILGRAEFLYCPAKDWSRFGNIE